MTNMHEIHEFVTSMVHKGNKRKIQEGGGENYVPEKNLGEAAIIHTHIDTESTHNHTNTHNSPSNEANSKIRTFISSFTFSLIRHKRNQLAARGTMNGNKL